MEPVSAYTLAPLLPRASDIMRSRAFRTLVTIGWSVIPLFVTASAWAPTSGPLFCESSLDCAPAA